MEYLGKLLKKSEDEYINLDTGVIYKRTWDCMMYCSDEMAEDGNDIYYHVELNGKQIASFWPYEADDDDAECPEEQCYGSSEAAKIASINFFNQILNHVR